MTTKRLRREYRRRAVQSVGDARKRTGRKGCGFSKAYEIGMRKYGFARRPESYVIDELLR